ncbi:MAG: ABC transporter permease [Candidatus Binatia bacterium]
MEAHVVGNLIAAATALLAGWVLAGSPRRRRLAATVARRSPVPMAVVGLFALLALLDGISWRGGDALGKPRTVIDRLAPPDFRERSYSAPLADREFYGGAPLRSPGRHLLGTDILGRDTLLQTLKGAHVALLVGGFTSLIVIPLGLVFGVAAGYFGRRVDDAIVFVMSTLASMPGILLLIALIMALGRGTAQVCVALGVTSWVGFCRVLRGETMKLRELEYVQAARALGASAPAILARHVVPNLMHLVVITFVLLFSGLVLSEAVLSWLSIGIEGSWGQMIDQARDELSRDPAIWWNLAAAASALFGLILSVNLLGDTVRDVLDPRG